MLINIYNGVTSKKKEKKRERKKNEKENYI